MKTGVLVIGLWMGISLGLLLQAGCSDKSTGSRERRMSLSVSSLEFTAWAGFNPDPAQHKVVVSIDGSGTTNWTASAGASWLRLGPGGSDTIFVSVLSEGLSAGVYVDTITVESLTATNSPLMLSVYLTVLNRLVLSPESLTFTALAGGTAPATLELEVTDFEGQSVNYEAFTGASWINLSETTGIVPGTVSVSVDIAGLPGGQYLDSVVVTSPDLPDTRVSVLCHLNLSSWAALDLGFGSTGVNLEGLAFTNNLTGWVSGWLPSGGAEDAHGIVYRTVDGGDTWAKVLDRRGTRFGGLAALDVAQALVVGDSAWIEFTSDSGNTWVKMTDLPIGATTGITNIVFVGYHDGWAVGDQGTIIHTVDGGQNWVLQQTQTPFVLTDIAFLDTQTGWAVGDHGTILHTSDAGANWISQNTETIKDLRGIYFVDNMLGWAVGSDGVILKTTNGGATWSALEIEMTSFLLDVSFVNSTHGWVVGLGGTIRHTNDGGTTWLDQLTGTDNGLTEVFFLNENLGWVAGDDGTVLKTASGGF